MLDQAGQPDRDDEEQADREHERHDARCRPRRRPRSPARASGKLRVGARSRAPASRCPATRPAPPRRGSPAADRLRWPGPASADAIAPSASAHRASRSDRRRPCDAAAAPSAADRPRVAIAPASVGARRRACAPRPPRSRRRASSRPRAPPDRRPARRATAVSRWSPSALICGRAGHQPAAPARAAAPALGDAALEALDAPTGVDQLLAAGVERMAGRADLDVDLGLGRARHELVAARAADVSFDVLGWISVFMVLSSVARRAGPRPVTAWLAARRGEQVAVSELLARLNRRPPASSRR